jgi:NTE family protein
MTEDILNFREIAEEFKRTSDEEISQDIDNFMIPEILTPSKIKIKKRYKHLVLSGGSIRGISQLGALSVLIHHNLIDLDNIVSIAGVSVGSIVGCLLLLKFTIDEIWDFVLSIDFSKLIHPNIAMLLKKCGMDSGKIIYNIVEEILFKKTGISNITFKQLFDITGIHYIVVGSCLTTKEAIYYDYINYPNFIVSVAIRISYGIAGLFTPVSIDNKKYIDGSFLDNYPIHLFQEKMEETIGILICHNYDTSYQYPEQYFMAVINLFMYKFYHQTLSKFPENTIFIGDNNEEVSMLNFSIDDNTKHSLFDEGKRSANQFVKQYWDITITNEDFD